MKWILPANEPKKNELIEFILKERGVKNADSFLNPNLKQIHDPFKMFGIEHVAKAIIHSIRQNKKIAIHGDFDVDGISATSIMFDFLYRELKADVIPIIPNRFTEGYGLSEETIKRSLDNNADVIITVDCGNKGH